MSTLSSKYLLLNNSIKMHFFKLGPKHIGYAVELNDGDAGPAFAWSAVEQVNELKAIHSIAQGNTLSIAVFNELAENTMEALFIQHRPLDLHELLDHAECSPVITQETIAIRETLRRAGSGTGGTDIVTLHVPEVTWTLITTHHFDPHGKPGRFSIDDYDEGPQQEASAMWLIGDLLGGFSAVRSPQVHEPGKIRELTDLILGYSNASILIESKALSILARSTLPNRPKLSSDLIKHIRKAKRQLIGASINLKGVHPITDRDGQPIALNRQAYPHGIVLVPDLSRLS